MKIFIIAKDFADEVSSYLNIDDFKTASFSFFQHTAQGCFTSSQIGNRPHLR